MAKGAELLIEVTRLLQEPVPQGFVGSNPTPRISMLKKYWGSDGRWFTARKLGDLWVLRKSCRRQRILQ